MPKNSFTAIGGIGIIIIALGVILALTMEKKIETAPKNLDTPTTIKTPIVNQENPTIIPSQKRTDARGTYYEKNINGERCAVVELNDYIPTKNVEEKTYEWIIEFPADNCVIQKPATNLPEILGKTYSENISETNNRKITVSYQ